MNHSGQLISTGKNVCGDIHERKLIPAKSLTKSDNPIHCQATTNIKVTTNAR